MADEAMHGLLRTTQEIKERCASIEATLVAFLAKQTHEEARDVARSTANAPNVLTHESCDMGCRQCTDDPPGVDL